MTLRLVALMSVVLLLSLGAFGLMMNYYQDSVMDEVARTASEVGRATLRTLESRAPGQAATEAHAVVGGGQWVAAPGTIVRSSAGVSAPEPGAEPAPGKRTEEVEVRVQRIDAPVGPADHLVEMVPATMVSGFAFVCSSDDGELNEEDCLDVVRGSGAPLEDQFFIDIDRVRAESDPSQGLVLTIETLKPETAGDPVKTVVERIGDDPNAAPTFVFRRHEDIRLPIPVKEYDSLFAQVRRRSLWVFLGVFAVGSVLTAGLASRFTRPIRQLDSGIRQLSSGDLDVQVPTRGNDEIARLGRAFNDMTRSLRANRQRASEMLRREKHSALGRLAAGVAHDIRNPLHSIGLTLEHLGESCRPERAERGAEFDRSIEIIRGEIRRLDEIVGNFLRFSRSEAVARRTIPLNDLLTETANLVRKEAEWRGVTVHLDLDDDDPAVEADVDALRSSLLNLVLNSFEAMPDGGKLRLAVDSGDEHVAIEVIDSGEGVPAEDQDRVFDFDYTTKESGNGLGLAMVYQCIVEDHGGRVTLEGPPEGGTRVRMTLPRGQGSRTEEIG